MTHLSIVIFHKAVMLANMSYIVEVITLTSTVPYNCTLVLSLEPLRHRVT